MNNTPPEPSAHPTQLPPAISLAPGFSRVSPSQSWGNRFNGFPTHEPEAVETALLPARLNARLKPGANASVASRRRCGLPSLTFAALAAALLCAPPLFAQVKTEPVPVKPAAPPVPPVPAVPPVPRKLSSFQTGACVLEEAVRVLQVQLQLNKMEPLNILFGRDTEGLEVQELNLHNVTGADALQLLATSAGCTVEPMHSTDAQAYPGQVSPIGYRAPVIGYTFRAIPKPQSVASAGLPVFRPVVSPVLAKVATGRLTRIYPLGAVTSRGDARLVLDDIGNPKPSASLFPDLEKTLRDVLKTDGVAENQVTLAFHEKTNVLVVNAVETVHVLVAQLLQALEQNVGQTAAFNRTLKLQTDLADRDKELRELQRELRQLQNPAPKPPSAK